jgi:hypothetical protein
VLLRRPAALAGVEAALHFRAPVDDWILSGRKVIETRRYALSMDWVGRKVAIIQCGVEPKGRQRGRKLQPSIVGVVTFKRSFKYADEAAWAADEAKHLVPSGHPVFGWPAGGKLFVHGWPVASVERLQHRVRLPHRGSKMPTLRGTGLVSIRDGVLFRDPGSAFARATRAAARRPETTIGEVSSKSQPVEGRPRRDVPARAKRSAAAARAAADEFASSDSDTFPTLSAAPSAPAAGHLRARARAAAPSGRSAASAPAPPARSAWGGRAGAEVIKSAQRAAAARGASASAAAPAASPPAPARTPSVAMLPTPPRAKQVSVLLCTVTFHANLAHSLTRSP